MKYLFGLLAFGSLFLANEAVDCPNGGFGIPNENVCYYPFTNVKYYVNVIHYCESIGAIPAKIRNLYENAFVTALDGDQNQTKAYIGVERQPDNTWLYADGTPVSYFNWAAKEPNNKSTSLCAVIDPQTGKWTAAECTVGRPFICSNEQSSPSISSTGSPIASTTRRSGSCSNGWVYNQVTQFCYYLQNFTLSDGQHWDLYNWTTAESNCRLMGPGSHLVSIHDINEDNFIYDLITSNVANVPPSVIPPNRNPCDFDWAFIGLYGNGVIGNGNWTDGTPVDYISSSTTPRGNWWQIANDASCGYKQWLGFTQSDTIPRYVCKMRP